MKTFSEGFKEELGDVIEKYVNDFEREEFRKNEAEQDTELKYSKGKVYYKNVDLVNFLFDNGSGYEYDEFIEHYKEFMANDCKGVIGYYDWIDDHISMYDFKLNGIIHRYNKATNEEEKERIEDELKSVFSGGYKGFFSDDISETYETDEVIDIVVEEMLKDTSIIEEFVSDYYDTGYDLNNLIKLGKEHGLFADYSCDDDDD